VVRSHRQATSDWLGLGAAAIAIWLGPGCGPGAVVGDESEDSTESSTEDSTSETGKPNFPELPETQPGCLERGGMHALIGEPHLIISDHLESIDPGDLEPTSDGLLAFFDMSTPENLDAYPNAWAARLDEHGTPIADPFPMFERGVSNGPRVHAFGDDFMVTFAGLWGYENRAGAVAINSLGEPLAAEQLRQPDDRHCCISGHSPEGAWTGHRHLFTWRDNSSGPLPGFELLLEGFTSDGNSLGWTQIQDDGDFHPEPRFVVTNEAAFMISAAGQDGVMLHRFDAAGTWLQDQAVTLELLSDFSVGDAALAVNADGFVIWLEENDLPARVLRWHLDPEGQLLAGPIEVPPPGPDSYDSNFELATRPGGFALAAQRDHTGVDSIVVIMLDATGEPTDSVEIEPELEPEMSLRRPRVAQRGDSTFVLYEAVDDATHDLLIAEIGCVEP
jgi:hypothetical protein